MVTCPIALVAVSSLRKEFVSVVFGSQQPNEQVIAMLQMEAQQIQALMFQQQQNMGQNMNQMPQGYMNQQQPMNYQNNGQQRQW